MQPTIPRSSSDMEELCQSMKAMEIAGTPKNQALIATRFQERNPSYLSHLFNELSPKIYQAICSHLLPQDFIQLVGTTKACRLQDIMPKNSGEMLLYAL